MMKEKILTLLPAATLNLTTETDEVWCVDYVICDSPFCSFSAQASGSDAGLADRSGASNGQYSATDAACKIASTGSINGPFQKIYVHSLSDSIRVHISKLKDLNVDKIRKLS
jgi:hypothetical protein